MAIRNPSGPTSHRLGDSGLADFGAPASPLTLPSYLSTQTDLYKSQLLLGWFRSTIPGLVHVRDRGPRHDFEILVSRVVGHQGPETPESLGARRNHVALQATIRRVEANIAGQATSAA
jgi:hypothetical protein